MLANFQLGVAADFQAPAAKISMVGAGAVISVSLTAQDFAFA